MQRQKTLMKLTENRALHQSLLAQLLSLQQHGIRREITRNKTARIRRSKRRIGATHHRMQQRHRGKQRKTSRHRPQRIRVVRRIRRVDTLRAQRQPGLLHRPIRRNANTHTQDALTERLRRELTGVHGTRLHERHSQLHRIVRAALFARLIKMLERTYTRDLLSARLRVQLLAHRELLRVTLHHLRHLVRALTVQLLTALSTLSRQRIILAAACVNIPGTNYLKRQEEERELPRPREEQDRNDRHRPHAPRITEPKKLYKRTHHRKECHGASPKRHAGGAIQQVGRATRLAVLHDCRAKDRNRKKADQVQHQENNGGGNK